jgi:hypothetical protein
MAEADEVDEFQTKPISGTAMEAILIKLGYVAEAEDLEASYM